MDWDAIGAIGEVIGAAGVIVTLGFLATQIRQNTKEARLAAIGELAREYNAFLRHVTEDAEICSLWRRAVDGSAEDLSADERARGMMLMGHLIRTVENAFTLWRSGRMSDGDWTGYERALVQATVTDLFSFYWRVRADWHSPAFRAHAEALVAEGRERTPVFE